LILRRRVHRAKATGVNESFRKRACGDPLELLPAAIDV
jgi:hypothetical protein